MSKGKRTLASLAAINALLTLNSKGVDYNTFRKMGNEY